MSPIADAVGAQLAEWGPRYQAHPLAALALSLAITLDSGAAGLATAAVARELRACLADLAPKEDDDGDATAALLGRLSAAMGDPQKPSPKKPRPKSGAGGGRTRNAAAPVAEVRGRRSAGAGPAD